MVETEPGGETILLVEDEPAIRQLMRRMLEQRGFAVLEARNGQEATRVLKEHRGDVHLLLTDVVMPGMSGFELADRLVESRPALRVLFLSGYGDSQAVKDGLDRSQGAFLLKPFTQDDLARKLREVLDAPQA